MRRYGGLPVPDATAPGIEVDAAGNPIERAPRDGTIAPPPAAPRLDEQWLNQTLDDPEPADDRARAAAEITRSFDWTVVGQTFVKLIEGVLDGRECLLEAPRAHLRDRYEVQRVHDEVVSPGLPSCDERPVRGIVGVVVTEAEQGVRPLCQHFRVRFGDVDGRAQPCRMCLRVPAGP